MSKVACTIEVATVITAHTSLRLAQPSPVGWMNKPLLRISSRLLNPAETMESFQGNWSHPWGGKIQLWHRQQKKGKSQRWLTTFTSHRGNGNTWGQGRKGITLEAKDQTRIAKYKIAVQDIEKSRWTVTTAPHTESSSSSRGPATMRETRILGCDTGKGNTW